MKIIVGLGNPGDPYQRSRHNIGFQVVDQLAEENHISISHKRFKTRYGKGVIQTQEVLLVKPLTYMNLSGSSVQKVFDFYKVSFDDLVVIHDDLDLPFGTLRIKRRGGDGGHQGVRSIVESLGRNTFLRLKVGISRPPRGMDPAEYVLSPFNEVEQHHLEEVLSRAAEWLAVLITEGIETALNRTHKKLILPSQSP